MLEKYLKTLSKNDTGETHSHQGGIRIPYTVARGTGVFPEFPSTVLNPREEVVFYDEKGIMRKFQFIWYNDEFFREDKRRGHNEYRLTCVNSYLKENDAKTGDEIWFAVDDEGKHYVGLVNHHAGTEIEPFGGETIRLSGGWTKTIEFNTKNI